MSTNELLCEQEKGRLITNEGKKVNLTTYRNKRKYQVKGKG